MKDIPDKRNHVLIKFRQWWMTQSKSTWLPVDKGNSRQIIMPWMPNAQCKMQNANNNFPSQSHRTYFLLALTSSRIIIPIRPHLTSPTKAHVLSHPTGF